MVLSYQKTLEIKLVKYFIYQAQIERNDVPFETKEY